MSKEIFEALRVLEAERGIPMDFMLEKIKKAIATACKNSYEGNEDVVVDIDENTGNFDVRLLKTVVDEVVVDGYEISLEDAKKIDSNAEIDGQVAVPLDTKEFGRIAAQTARNIIRQGIKDGERSQITQEFQDRKYGLASALVERVDPQTGVLTLRIGRAESMLPQIEKVGIEDAKEGDHVKVYISEVYESEKGPKVMVSRTSPNFLRKLFETEVPEISSGDVEIKAVSREAGARSKVAVVSHDENVDPVGSCIGAHGSRVNVVVDELGGEKVDIIEYSEDPCEFIKQALLPAEVVDVSISSPEDRQAIAVVPNDQLSLAIGNRGQNVRLAARLTGWKIDIRPQSGNLR